LSFVNIPLLCCTAIESIPTDDEGRISLFSQPIAIDPDISPSYQLEVFLTAKTVRIRFLRLVAQLEQKLKDYDPQSILETCNKLTASSGTTHKAIPLLPYEYLEDLDNASTKVILNRLAFLWSWINHSVLRALLEACNCLEGIKMLDDFKSQIDTDQPMELFPIPPPSMKMAPSSSSAYTVLSIRGEGDLHELTPLQYINDVAVIMVEKTEISSHALHLMAAQVNPLTLYWIIPKSVVSLIHKGVSNHLDFLKENKFTEIVIYPSTILFSMDNLNLGPFTMLSNEPQLEVIICLYFVY